MKGTRRRVWQWVTVYVWVWTSPTYRSNQVELDCLDENKYVRWKMCACDTYMLNFIMIKFGYNARCQWLRVLYQSTKHSAELKLSRHLLNCTMLDLFRDFSLVFFVNWKKNFGASKPASSNRRTKQGFVNMLSAIIYVTIAWAETKIQRQNEMDGPNIEGFHAQLDCKLTYGNKNQTQLTLV